jgi:hypothetical protein
VDNCNRKSRHLLPTDCKYLLQLQRATCSHYCDTKATERESVAVSVRSRKWPTPQFTLLVRRPRRSSRGSCGRLPTPRVATTDLMHKHAYLAVKLHISRLF